MIKSLLSLLLFIHCASLGFAQSQWLSVKKWAFNTGGAVESSPAIGSDGTIYVGSSAAWPQTDGRIYAINPDGSKKWEFSLRDVSFASPVISSDGTIYLGASDRTLYAINSDGSKKWE